MVELYFGVLSFVLLRFGYGLERQYVSINEGLIIQRLGDIHEAKEDIILSLLVKLPDFDLSDLNFARSCYILPLTEAKVKRSLITGVHHKLVADKAIFVESRRKLLKKFMSLRQVHDRHSRGVLSFLGSVLFSGALTGITEIQIQQIKGHIQDNTEAISKMHSEILSINHNLIKVRNNMIGMVRSVTYDMSNAVRKLQCMQQHLTQIMSWRMDFMDYKLALDDLLWTALSGSNDMLLRPDMIDPISLNRIVNESEQFINTFYKDYPMMLYSVAKFSLIEIDYDLRMGHFVLIIPMLHKFMYPLFEVKQVKKILGEADMRRVCYI